MLKKILFNIIALIAYRTNEIVMAITLIVWILYTKNWLAHDSSSAIFVIFFAVILYLPVFFVVFYLLMLIPKFVCFIILQIIYAKARYDKDKDDEFERFWDEQEKAYDDIECEQREREEREEKERQNEQAWQNSYESWKRTYERYHSQQEENYQRTYSENKQQGSTDYDRQQYSHGAAGHKKDELHDALSFYGLSIPFTQDKLKEKRRKLMKTAHPDEGGDVETAADINRFFDILKKYAD